MYNACFYCVCSNSDISIFLQIKRFVLHFFTNKLVAICCIMLELEQILAEGHVAVPLISTTLDIVKVVVVAARAPGQ